MKRNEEGANLDNEHLHTVHYINIIAFHLFDALLSF